MRIARTSRRLRHALAVATVAGASLAGAGAAVADQPVIEVPAAFQGGVDQVGSFYAEANNVIKGARGSAVVYQPGHRASQRYCNGYGANTELVEARIRAIRWHTQSLTGYMRVVAAGQETWRMSNDAMGVGVHNYGWVGANNAQCVDLGYYQSGTNNGGSGWNPTFTAELDAVRVRDLQGPAVANLWTPDGWVTGGAATLHWDTGDNDFARGSTGAYVVGGGSVDLGATGNGRVGADIAVGSLPDGVQTLVAYRDAPGWDRRTAAVNFRLDRNAPAAPPVIVAEPAGSGAWVNTDVAVSTAATSDGSGSGWTWNELSNGAANGTTLNTTGVHQIGARAWDGAGHASDWTWRTVRIDKVAPTAQLLVTDATTPGRVSLSKGATDDGNSGLASWQVRLGDASGPVVATTVAELTALGQSAPTKDAGTVRFTLVARDNAGNVSTAQTPPVRLDSQAPTASITKAPTGWINGFQVTGTSDNRLAISLHDNLPDGLGEVVVKVQQGTGAPVVVAHYNAAGAPALGQGDNILINPSVAGLGLVDGPAQVTVEAADPAFPALRRVSPPVAVQLDLTSPQAVERNGWKATPVAPGKFAVALPTLGDGASGLAKVEVYASTDPTGAAHSMVKVGEAVSPGASPTVAADVQSFSAAGIHATEIRATDAAGNVMVTTGPSLIVDQVAPTISRLSLDSATGALSFFISDNNGFGVKPLTIELQGAGTQGAWRTVLEQAAQLYGSGRVDFTLPMEGMPSGEYQVRVTLSDAGGNTTAQTVRFRWVASGVITDPGKGLPGAPGIPGAPGASGAAGAGGTGSAGGGGSNADGQNSGPNLSEVRILGLSSPQSKLMRTLPGGQTVPVLRVRYGQLITLRGRFQHRDGTGLASAKVELRDSAGRFRAGTRTDKRGSFTFRTRAVLGGVWTVAALGQPERRAAAILEVTPIVRASFSRKALRQGQIIRVRGVILPRAGSYAKAIQLQFKQGRTWRPMANGRIARNGTFKLTYRFRTGGGYKVALRVAVPAERGWSFQPTSTRPVTVRVR